MSRDIRNALTDFTIGTSKLDDILLTKFGKTCSSAGDGLAADLLRPEDGVIRQQMLPVHGHVVVEIALLVAEGGVAVHEPDPVIGLRQLPQL